MPDDRLDPKIIKPKIESLIDQAQSIEPLLANRLSQIKRSIKDYVPAKLMSRRILVDFLSELIADSKVYLDLRQSSLEKKRKILEDFTPCEKYWYQYLFPQWFSKHDRSFSTWAGKIKNPSFSQQDQKLIDQLSINIEKLGGDCLWGFILDFSMKTDLVISAGSNQTLCVQLTISSPSLVDQKKTDWESTLKYWGISRGLFISFNPQGEYKDMTKLATFVLQKDDQLPNPCYDVCYI